MVDWCWFFHRRIRMINVRRGERENDKVLLNLLFWAGFLNIYKNSGELTHCVQRAGQTCSNVGRFENFSVTKTKSLPNDVTDDFFEDFFTTEKCGIFLLRWTRYVYRKYVPIFNLRGTSRPGTLRRYVRCRAWQ